MKPVKIYDVKWNEIPKNDWPEVGQIYVCLDPQNTLGNDTWSVSIMGDGSLTGDTVRQGLFWNKDNAVLFAYALQVNLNKF